MNADIEEGLLNLTKHRGIHPRDNATDRDVVKHLVLKDPDILFPARIVYYDLWEGNIEQYVQVIGTGDIGELSGTSLRGLFYLEKRHLNSNDFDKNTIIRSISLDKVLEYEPAAKD